MKRQFRTKSLHRLHLNNLNNQVVKALDIFVTSFAGRDATPDTQKEEIANTKGNELYEVPTSCDPQKKEGSTEMKEDLLYEVPPQ